MTQLNIAEAKAHFSEIIQKALQIKNLIFQDLVPDLPRQTYTNMDLWFVFV